MSHPALSGPSLRRAGLAFLLAISTAGCVPGGRGPQPAFLPPTRPAQFSMQGIPWGVSSDSVKALIEPRGYNYNITDDDGDMWFDGMLLNTPTRVFAFMGTDSLVKIRVRLITADENAFPVYEKARAELIKLYGRPQETNEDYTAPFVKGKNDMQAVSEGKAAINTHWIVGSGRRETHVAVTIDRDLVVVVDYEGPAWNREYLKRRRGN